MRAHERASQIWTALGLAAINRQVLTYPLLSRLVGVPQAALGKLLEPIQSYCLLNKLPPLTILVVSSKSGLPGSGFIAAADIPRNQQLVFSFNWLKRGAPQPEDFADAVKQRPSNGIR